nr:hypothetical protein [Ectobacillus ponti]
MNSSYYSYWKEYSDMGTWQFWAIAALLIVPLVVLFFTVDRKRIFELFFFGYTVHILWTYIDIAMGRAGYFTHKYFLIPILPISFSITASVLPVGFLLLYQYCTNHKKNFYLFTLLLSAIFAFVFASLEEYLGMVAFRKGLNALHLYLIDLGIACIAYWSTRLLLQVTRRAHS